MNEISDIVHDESLPPEDVRSSNSEDSVDELLQLVGFNLGDEEFGVDILKVQEINRMIDITKVPQSPDYVEGVINLRGEIIPVIDLRKRFGLPKKDPDRHTRIIVAEVGESTLGFVVDAVSEVIRIKSNTVEPPPPIVKGQHAEYIQGVGKLDGRLLMLLDIDKVLTQSEISSLDQLPEA